MTTDTTPLYAALGLTTEEFERIRKTIGRDPSHTELAMFSVMWSEHCSYKSSRIHLRELPSDAPWLVVGPGADAGVVQIAPAFSPGPCSTRAPEVGRRLRKTRECLYAQCSDQSAEKSPSSV